MIESLDRCVPERTDIGSGTLWNDTSLRWYVPERCEPDAYDDNSYTYEFKYNRREHRQDEE